MNNIECLDRCIECMRQNLEILDELTDTLATVRSKISRFPRTSTADTGIYGWAEPNSFQSAEAA